MKPGSLFMVCCACLLLLAGCCTVYSLSQLSPQQIAVRNNALRSGELPPQNLWLKSEYSAYWDGHEYGYDDFWEPLPFSTARHQSEFSYDVQFFYRSGYAKGWAEAKAEAVADGESPQSSSSESSSDGDRSSNSATSGSSSRPRPSSSSRSTRRVEPKPPAAPPAPVPSGGGTKGGLIIPRRF